jgi:hypothetical protein
MSEIPIIERSAEVYKDLVQITSSLDKKHRYALGQNTEVTLLDFIELIISAKHAPKASKALYLIKSTAKLEILKIKCRVFLELGLTNETDLFKIQEKLAEIGRMLGGWLKSNT